jgi:hypothetical protein
MPAAPLTLSSALTGLYKAVPLIASNYTTVGGWTALAATEGEITVGGLGAPEIQGLTAREHTGGMLHKANVLPPSPTINIPVLAGDSALWDKITPYGSADGVPDNPPAVATKSLWLVPLDAWDGIASIGYDGATWTPADSPTRIANAILFLKGFFTHDDFSYRFDEAGKSITMVHFTPMYDSAAPAGKRGWIRGNPVAKGLTTFRV